MKKLFLFLILMLLLIPFTSCEDVQSTQTPYFTSNDAVQDTTSPITTTPSSTTPITSTSDTSPSEVIVISPDEAKEMMDQGGVIIVDVRREDEYAVGHIENAILVPNETIESEAATALPDKNAVYLIYCRSGRRSNEAAHKLVALGYQHVYDFGGILSWEYPTVTD